ncbi:response regulator [Paenibacillus oceani]|jgi:two-component system response regulator YesN|uniref:Response regulator n=1 Tax=Paenibacillus oceani TaxID=2772510 RepID=A0A927C850_9BACL|nr:response regulator [Paenibacillus oceani]MBD2861115.1 response regulator [Paenibacillus oceani]MDF2658748.1 hypothetical protein [Paenibacillus sp.]
MNVLIVDDEPIIRIGLRTLVDWEEHGFHLVGEASDGIEALECFRKEQIDIVITDIRMPRMDGLALMREVKELQEDVGLLVLSCLDDFSLVKEAMKLGAQDYILKPTMEPDGLVDILRSVRAKLDEERHTKRVIAEWQEQLKQSKAYRLADWLRQYVQAGVGEARLEAELFQRGAGTFSIWVETDSVFRPSLEEWTIPHSKAVLKWSDKVWIVMGGTDRSLSEKERHEWMFGCAQSVYTKLKEAAPPQADWFVGLGPVIPKAQDFVHALAVHRRQGHRYFYGEAGPLIVDDFPAAEEAPLPVQERNDFLRAVSNGNKEAAGHWIEMIAESIRRYKPNVAKLQSFVCDMLGLAAGFARQQSRRSEDEPESVSLEQIRSIPRADLLCSFMVEEAEQLWGRPYGGERSKASNNPFIKKAVQFMREQYRRNIGTVDIADHVKLSRSYLSDLFSKEMGESLTETLTRIRIEEAKKKLLSGEMKVYEIAEAVGFSDPKSFAKTFKRLVGCTPKEFEATHK